MKQLISFVAAYVEPIIAVIFGVPAVYFYSPRKGTYRTWNVLVKVAATMLGIAVIYICYLDFTAKLPEDAKEVVIQTENNHGVSPTETAYTQPLKIDEVIPFGTYKPDGISGDGPETIEWRVLDVQGNKALLLSLYALDSKPYNDIYGKTTWKSCTLHRWLNSTFLDAAFTAEEKSVILATEFDNRSQDAIFLLSREEVDRYFRNEEDRICKPTDYVASMEGKTRAIHDGTACAVWWWLRSLAEDGSQAFYVNFEGKCYTNAVGNQYLSVRPALWIDLEKYDLLY